MRTAAFLCVCLVACGDGPAAAPPAQAPPATETAGGEGQLAIPNAAEPLPQITTGGQPSAQDLQLASELGYRTVVSFRTDGEAGSEGEREQVEALGMRFVSIPVAGPDDLTVANAQRLAEALGEQDALPAIVHCGSGNRAGAMLALKAFHVDGKSAEEALELGRRAGLTKLEEALKERLVAE